MKGNVLFWKGKGFFIFFFLLLGFNYASGQITKIQGIVTNAAGILPGVTVSAEGSSLKTQTDANGQYSLNTTGANAVIFTFIGYEKQRVVLQDITDSKNGIYTLNVTLKESEGDLLDEVVVVGFGTQKKTNLTGSVAVVDAKQLENRPVRNAIQALQGLAPGLNISQNGGSLESNPAINIRGVGTIGTSSSSPLVLIDGSEGSLAALNPQDIESVSVLKDAGAASIYGSRAAFGVILVTTKSGKVGKTSVNYNNSLRMNKPTLMPKMMDSYTFAQYFNQAEVNGNGTPHFSEEYLKRILDYQNGSNKNSIIVSPDNSQYWQMAMHTVMIM
ncbi:TonB-dependent receptor plug domain-containing protein [Sphingobacterium sp. IITKGP-BTPF85]|uniref:TonB-dependent receptor plug domain-containing protein n=1 Tax=Sphingobacterium sp. IITKGP-BTPF85 TaxID=1338009 RepID=UPI00040156A4|nr:TonB-dependent receptor plug domain-containing protein [Sphingobacterium sp. IITKGP-BTPF85]